MNISRNQVTLIGTVGKDPEVTHHPNGTVIAKLPLATVESWKDKATGEWQERTTWISLQCWGKFAEDMENEVRKGTRLYIEGKIVNDSWEDEKKVKHYKTYVQISSYDLLASRARRGTSNDNDMSRM